MSQTLFDKIWERHVVVPEKDDHPAVIYIDLHLIHEVTSPQAFTALKENNLTVRCPQKTLGTADHSIPTNPTRQFADQQAADQVSRLLENCREHGIRCLDLNDPAQGIVHVVGPELGYTQPGMTIVCGDSHTSTHGAFGALAFGIGTSEVTGVLATQCLLQRKPKTLSITLEGTLAPLVTAKDVALHVIAKLGAGGGAGFVIEFRGEVVRGFSMESRMTLCNMSIEAGARAGMVAPDDVTFAYLRSKLGEDWQPQSWQRETSDPKARFDREVFLDVSELTPVITYGTSPDQSLPIHANIPSDAASRCLDYMGFESGGSLTGIKVDVVFVGSCTNGRIEDLRLAAKILEGKKVAAHTRMLIVPGSGAVKRAAEAEGLDRVFMEAGAEWREPGCSMCIAMNGDQLQPGQLAVSTSNRNFEGRQGPGGRTMLASPATAAACAVAGAVADPRFLEVTA
ncbi:MAG: 3-isopropylmalate dehydratase large subunit [Acidobacteria bacterium]|nr:3-isopropylmalate dehydratase large subunit [Acidobacteriota bacterium]